MSRLLASSSTTSNLLELAFKSFPFSAGCRALRHLSFRHLKDILEPESQTAGQARNPSVKEPQGQSK
jgi:hypothetical protein